MLGLKLLLISTFSILCISCSCFSGSSLTPPPKITDLPPAPLPSIGSRTFLFISDLHLGVGKDPQYPEQWHPTEDFRWHREFQDFLNRMSKDEEDGIDLIILGDAFELWQSVKMGSKDCDHSRIDKNLGCTEEEAVIRMKRIVSQHEKFFQAISSFAGKGDNRVYFVPGNHDAALLFNGVEKIVLSAFPSAQERIRIVKEGYWISADGKILAEHGHQIDYDPNWIPGWPTFPFWRDGEKIFLAQPWGEQFVQEFYNDYEYEFQIVDNLSSEWEGFKKAVVASKIPKVIDAAWRFLQFTLTRTSWEQTVQGLGENGFSSNGTPYWNVQEVIKKYEGRENEFLLDALPPSDPLRNALKSEIDNQRSLIDLHTMTPEEIRAICTNRWMAKWSNPKSDMTDCLETKGRGMGAAGRAIYESVISEARKERYKTYLKDLKDNLPKTNRPTNNFMLYVYGHTHKVEGEMYPFPIGSNWRPKVINEGAWQRTVTPNQLCAIAKKKKISESDVLRKVKLEDLPACYPFLRVESETKEFTLEYWVQGQEGEGTSKIFCPFELEIPMECK